MMQSESVQKSLGMNYKSLYYPSVRMGCVLRETQAEGNSRIEITFTASTREAENEFFHPLFNKEAKIKLDKAEYALKKVPELVWHLS